MSHPVTVQAGSYVAEMSAAHGGRQHVIGLIIVDDLLYLWHYDRQGMIQCTTFNFIQDLPRFLVLLLAMQRFEDHHWGLSPYIDPEFGTCPGSHEIILHDEQGSDIDITLDLSLSKERVTHFGLNGCATNLFPVTSKKLLCENSLVAKVFWTEEACKSEPEILKKVYEIAEWNEDVKGHVPDMVLYEAFWDTSTTTDGVRVLYLILFRKLKPITDLVGANFLHTWWAAVKCESSPLSG
ncbi:hypothetical protein EDC04DRAFT_2661120 [Pisolithus marmoratus]|nr:hypothetical protein EDC04DRAFT_2661120 [Pisolithus marmoratus]